MSRIILPSLSRFRGKFLLGIRSLSQEQTRAVKTTKPPRAGGGLICGKKILWRRLLAATALLAEAHLLGKLGSCRGVVRRHHRIIRRQRPFLAVLLGRHMVLRAQ